MAQNGSRKVDFDDPMDHHIGIHIWMESGSKTHSLSISNLGLTLEHILDRFFDQIQKSVVAHIFCTHLH